MGGGLYSRQYFSEERYTVLEANSFGHSVPIINGEGQKHGEEYRACDVCYSCGNFSLDIAGAYALPELKSLKRSFLFDDEAVSMKDVFDYSGEGIITERFILSHEPKIDGNEITVGNTSVKVLTEGCDFSVGTHTLKNNTVVYLLDARLPRGASIFEISIV